MRIEGDLIEGRFLARDNRFRATVEVAGRRVWAHLANSGRLGELLIRGRPVLLAERPAATRKTAYDLCMASVEGHWVSLDARLPNALVAEALRSESLTPLAGYPDLRREVRYGTSRLDFLLLADGRRPCLVEVKSVTLVVDGLGCFPDAVTGRGRRHLLELSAAVAEGYRAAVLFVVQREDAVGLRPHDESDPEFGRALRQAARRGVEVYAYGCRVDPVEIVLDRRLSVYLEE